MSGREKPRGYIRSGEVVVIPAHYNIGKSSNFLSQNNVTLHSPYQFYDKYSEEHVFLQPPKNLAISKHKVGFGVSRELIRTKHGCEKYNEEEKRWEPPSPDDYEMIKRHEVSWCWWSDVSNSEVEI